MSFYEKKLIVFDLDGTLTRSKSTMDRSMSDLLVKLLREKKVAVISGGKYGQFKKQFLAGLRCPRHLLPNLFLFPTSSTLFYRYKGGWKRVYARELGSLDRKKIKEVFQKILESIGYVNPSRLYGPVIEDRRTQITFSALGQRAPVRAKEEWNRKHDVRLRIMNELKKHLSMFEIRRGGLTSIDVTKKGIDKAYGILQIHKQLSIPIKEMLFIGDALYRGGNDYPARRTGIRCVAVSGPEETKKIIRSMISLG